MVVHQSKSLFGSIPPLQYMIASMHSLPFSAQARRPPAEDATGSFEGCLGCSSASHVRRACASTTTLAGSLQSSLLVGAGNVDRTYAPPKKMQNAFSHAQVRHPAALAVNSSRQLSQIVCFESAVVAMDLNEPQEPPQCMLMFMSEA